MNAAPADAEGIAARAALIEAGLRLLARHSPAAITPESVCAETGLDPAGFAQQFPTIEALHCAMLGRLSDGVRDKLSRVMTNMPPGLPRLQVAVETYLESSFANTALRTLSVHLRNDPGYAEFLRSRVTGLSLMMTLELRSLGHPQAAETARLLTAAALEVGASEQTAGRRLPALRASWLRYCQTAAP